MNRNMSGKPLTRQRKARPSSHGPATIIQMPIPAVVRRRRAIRAGAGVLILSLLCTTVLRIYLERVAKTSPAPASSLSEAANVLKAVNAQRVRAGLPPLKYSPRLEAVAQGHSYDMAIRGYFSRTTPEGVGPSQRMTGLRIDYRACDENIYVDHERELSADRVIATWLQEPASRALLLSSQFTETGVGVAWSADGQAYVTQDFVN